MKKKWAWYFVFLLAVVPIMTACSSGGDSAGDDDLFVTIATGGQTGVYYPLGAALGKLYEKELEAKTSLQATGASVENVNLLDRGRAEVAFIMGDAATQAYEGAEPFDKKVESFQAIASLYPNFVQIVTAEDSGIDSVADLKGKRVAVGAANSGTELNARAVLKAHDMSYDDMKNDFLDFAEAVDGIKNGTMDAAFINSGLPNPAITDLKTTKKVKMVPVKGEGMKKLKEMYPYYSEGVIPKDTYGNEKDVPTATVVNLLVVRADLDEDTVYNLTKTLFENLETLQDAHSAAKEIDLDSAQDNATIPFHPGAEKYFQEAGK